MAMNNEEVTIRIKLRSFEECIMHQYQLSDKYGDNSPGNQSDGLCGYVLFNITDSFIASNVPNPDGKHYMGMPDMGAPPNQQPILPVDKYTRFEENVTSNIEIFEIIYKYYHICHDEQVNMLKNTHNYITPIVKQINSQRFISGNTNSIEIPLEFVRPTKYLMFTLQLKINKDNKDY